VSLAISKSRHQLYHHRAQHFTHLKYGSPLKHTHIHKQQFHQGDTKQIIPDMLLRFGYSTTFSGDKKKKEELGDK